jgi:hypothetical protein
MRNLSEAAYSLKRRRETMQLIRLSVVAAALLAASLLSTRSTAQPAPSEGSDLATQQPEHIASCAADAAAKSIDGDALDSFMRTCLSRKTGEGNLNTEQKKMQSCTAKATDQGLEGEARTTAIDACLKPPPPAKPAT